MSHPVDGYNGVTVEQTIAPQTISGNGDYTEGADVDKGMYNAVLHVLEVGESGDTWGSTLYTDCILQDSADGTTYAAVTDAADYIGTMVTAASGIFAVLDAEAEDNAVHWIGYRGTKQYSRIYLDRTGNHATGTPMSAIAIKSNARFTSLSGLLPTG